MRDKIAHLRWQMTCLAISWLLGPLIGSMAGAKAGERLRGPVLATVEQVVDGDTLAVRAQIWIGQELLIKVRLDGIDTPELRARCAEERALADKGRSFVEKFLRTPDTRNTSIWLTDIAQGKFGGRVIARVANMSGADLSDALLQAGLARNYSGRTRQSWCPEQQVRR